MNINKYEVILNCMFWIGGVFYGIYGVFKVKEEFKNIIDDYDDFEEGWLVKTSKKDVSDFEWETMIKMLKGLHLWILIHLIVSEYLRTSYVKVLPYWQTFIAMTYMLYNTGPTGLLLILLQPLSFHYMMKKRNKFMLWIGSGFFLVLILCFKLPEIQNEFSYFTVAQHYIVMVTVSWIHLRCLSYSLDHVHCENKLIHLISYCLYLPTLCLGPFIQFENFKESYKNSPSAGFKNRMCQLLFSITRFGFWLILTEFCLHYFYINALSYQIKLLQSLDNWTLYGYGYCMGQFFHLKYVVLYGLSTSFARFEHIETPHTPKCIGRIHLYSDMWKYFDAGLYKFLVNYIYRPTLKSSTLCNKLFSSFLCFLFVYIWHGINSHILIWTAVNYIGICLENLFSQMYTLVPKVIDERWTHRLLCLICSPLLAASAVSNFYFFAGKEVGNIFVQRIFESSALANLMLIFFLYCCCHLSLEAKKWEQPFNHKKKKPKHS